MFQLFIYEQKVKGEKKMFLVIGLVLVVLWIVGFLTMHTAGFLIHILLILAVISIVFHFLRGGSEGRETATGRACSFVVVEQAEDVVVGELVAAFEEVELDGEGEAGDMRRRVCWTSLMVASMVPPVASRSSTRKTFWPGSIASTWISSESVPYSRS